MNIQYQFLKDPQRKKQFDKIVKPYGNRIVIPLEFWFDGQSPLYVPMLCLQHSDVFLNFELNQLVNLISNGPNSSTDTIKYKIINTPEININLNIDGIILDIPERELFGSNNHEYIIEIFKTYPNSLIDSVNTSSRMKFTNLVKDIFLTTQILSTGLNTYTSTTVTNDSYSNDYNLRKTAYEIFKKTDSYGGIVKVEYVIDFSYLKQAEYEINVKSERYLYFVSSPVLSKQNIEMCLYLDSKFQYNLNTLAAKSKNLIKYFLFNYKSISNTTLISPIKTMNIQTAGIDLFTALDSTYFNLAVPFQKYLNSVDMGYYAYSFALYPNEKQPSGHVNFSTLDDIVINTVNNSQVVNDPFILKTSVREYQILRIMSGMGALAWMNS
jgi:hypothetical protein